MKDYEAENIINISEKTYFCNIHLFIDFFKDMISIKTDDVIQQNLNKCL